MKTAFVCLSFALLLVACGDESPTGDPVPPLAIPAGISDPAWAALGRTCTAESPNTIVPPAQQSQMSQYVHGSDRTSDDDWSDLAKTMPGGFGGVFVENGTPVIYLRETGKRTEAIAALKQSPLAPFGIDLNTAIARPGRWTFTQLAEWYRLISPALPAPTGLRMHDIQEARNRIEYTVTTAAERAAIETKLQALNVPCFLVAVKLF